MFLLGEILRRKDIDPAVAEFLRQADPLLVLLPDQEGGLVIDLLKLLRRGQTVIAQGLDVGLDLPPQTGDAHHIEFIEVGSGNRQEAKPFEQRMGRIRGFFQNSPVKGQPGQFAVNQAFRAFQKVWLVFLCFLVRALYFCRHLHPALSRNLTCSDNK